MNLVIFGTGQFAEIAEEYFLYSDNYEFTCAARTVGEKYKKTGVYPFEDIEKHFPPEEWMFYAAIIYGDMNRTRERIYKEAKAKGYKLAGLIHDKTFVSRTARIGLHHFIFEGNVIQSDVTIGNNVVAWSSNHFGHSSIIEDNCFISSHIVISGNCRIGRNSFIGVNATIGDGVTIGEYSWVSPGAIVTQNVPPHSLVKSIKSEVQPLNEEALFRALKK